MATFDRAAIRTQCDTHRARYQCRPAKSAHTCTICPATYVCSVPLKVRAVLFGSETDNTATEQHTN
ncbi:MAG TPA: hypothetical protein VHV83_01430 [Armatimonadota bacterium]|nr:hypothetical protein [Armatimonadota bacterium]